MDAEKLAKALKRFDGNPWRVLTISGERAQVVMANGEVRSAIGLKELEKVLGVKSLLIGSHKR